MQTLIFKGGIAALFALALAPAHAQMLEDTVLMAYAAGGITPQVDVVGYSNITNFTGSAFANGGAAVLSGNGITRLQADDINFAAGAAGQLINRFDFNVANLNTTAVSARARVRFYADNAGAPGTLITGFSFSPISFGANSVGTFFTTLVPASQFTVPANGKMWAGMTFDNNTGATGATIAQLNNLGQGLFNPPTIGSSADVLFLTTAAGSNFVSNPAGGTLNFGGNPVVANTGWAFTITAAPVPEPGSVALLIGMGVSGLLLRRKVRK